MPAVALSRQDFIPVRVEGGNFLDPLFKVEQQAVCPKRKETNWARAEKRLFGGGVNPTPQGSGILDTVGNTAAEAFFEYGVPYLAKQGVRQGRYFASEFLREPEYQKKIASKAKPLARKAVNYTIDSSIWGFVE